MQTTIAAPERVAVRYFTAEEAAEEQQRRASILLLVEEWWLENGWGWPDLPIAPSRAVIARQLHSFRYEDAVFATMAMSAGMSPVWMSYTGDKMSTESNLKRSYIRPVFCSGVGRNGGLKLKSEQLTTTEASFGRRLDQIKIVGGTLLADYHQRHQERMFPGALRGDSTAWVQQIGRARDYYAAYLSLFLAHAVLFEDYYAGESGPALGPFTLEVFEPAHQKLVDLFGVEPLLVKLPWWDGLQYYPADPNWNNHGIRIEP